MESLKKSLKPKIYHDIHPHDEYISDHNCTSLDQQRDTNSHHYNSAEGSGIVISLIS